MQKPSPGCLARKGSVIAMPHELILQAMEEDYIEGIALPDLLQRLADQAIPAQYDEYYFSIYLNKISSESPVLHGVIHPNHGYFLSAYVHVENAQINFIATRESRSEERIRVRFHQDQLDLALHLFLPQQDALECIREFCVTASLSQCVSWIRYDELDRDLYA